MKKIKEPVGDTICNGRYRVVETLRDGGAQGLHRGVVGSRPESQVLVTTLLTPEKLRVEDVMRALVADVPGRLPFEALATFDVQGSDEDRNIYQKGHLALVERLPPGDWVGRLVGGDRAPVPPLSVRDATTLALSSGRLLAQAAEHGALMVGARPEYIWAERSRAGDLIATGISDRYQNFLRFTGGACAIPAVLLRRTYLAPELHSDMSASSASLTFSLATMLAEWLIGRYPFHEVWTGINMTNLLRGELIPFEGPPRLAHLLHIGTRPDPADRPSLSSFLAALEAFADEGYKS